MGVWDWVERDYEQLLKARCGLIGVIVIALGSGFSLARMIDRSEISASNADRDLARNCRQMGISTPPCPLDHSNARPSPSVKVVTKFIPVSDPAQAAEIARLKKIEDAFMREKSLDEKNQVRHLQSEQKARTAPLAASGF